MKTIRRDILKKWAAEKRLVMVSSYHFDDMHGADRDERELPVRIRGRDESGHLDHKEGYCNVMESDFTGSVGRAYYTDEGKGLIHLRVHSNHSVDFRRCGKDEWYGLVPLADRDPSYVKFVTDLAEKYAKTPEFVSRLWMEYVAACGHGDGGQSAIRSEFERWYAEKLGPVAAGYMLRSATTEVAPSHYRPHLWAWAVIVDGCIEMDGEELTREDAESAAKRNYDRWAAQQRAGR